MAKCVGCGDRFASANLVSKYCSSNCRKTQYIAANDNVDRSPRSCAECAVVFSPEYGDKRSVYCSRACSRRNSGRINRKKERARLRTQAVENVNPIKVFDRDGWKCQICGVKTPRNLRGTYDDMAPELDHIMPLSLGGAHSYMNTQCTCRKCNAAKSNNPPTQPSLFAYAA
ncbi:HNH endonuclease [Rhizobium phaseoli]|uniref:HNH endonuclease n=1 Tax=Rhizobium phaseoli TaxID=396 RepID=UPI003D6E68F1